MDQRVLPLFVSFLSRFGGTSDKFSLSLLRYHDVHFMPRQLAARGLIKRCKPMLREI